MSKSSGFFVMTPYDVFLIYQGFGETYDPEDGSVMFP
jgi:hypothetical protein